MEEKQAVNITFNITGGNNQILPNATKAEQHFHLSGAAGQVAPRPERDTPWTKDDIARLGLYVENRDRLNSLVATLSACRAANEAAEAVTLLLDDEPRLTPNRVVKKEFLELLLPFLCKVESGKGIGNLRRCVNNALDARRKSRHLQRP